MWYLYVVRCADDSLYTGVTTDVSRRIHEHNNTSKAAKYTRSRRPVKLVYTEEHHDRSAAQKAEAALKKLTRSQKLQHIRVVV
jgi:putative endonuclease